MVNVLKTLNGYGFSGEGMEHHAALVKRHDEASEFLSSQRDPTHTQQAPKGPAL